MTTFQEINTFKPFHFDNFNAYNKDQLSRFNPILAQRSSRKIKPQPIVYINLPNSKKLQDRLVIHGHKYFSKLAAAGPNTSKILSNMKRCPYTKSIKHFEFDPYMCDRSLLNPLSKIQRQVKNSTKINIVARRLDIVDETNLLFVLVSRISRLKKVRFELLSTPDMSEEGFIRLTKAFGKCLSLKTFEFSFPKLVSGITSLKVNYALERMWQRLLFLEEREVYISLHKDLVKSYIGYKFQVRKTRSKLKSLALRYMLNKGWDLIGSGNSMKLDKFLKTLEPHPLLENIKFQMIRVDISSEEIMKLMEGIKTREALKHFSLELLNCSIGELEAISFLYKLSNIPQLESINFKIIQSPNLTEPLIFAFIEAFDRMSNLKTFNLYFRGTELSPFDAQILQNKLSSIRNIQYHRTKESVQITRSLENPVFTNLTTNYSKLQITEY